MRLNGVSFSFPSLFLTHSSLPVSNFASLFYLSLSLSHCLPRVIFILYSAFFFFFFR